MSNRFMKLLISLVLLTSVMLPVQSQEKKAFQLLPRLKVVLQQENYPWWQELALYVKGYSYSSFEGATIQVNVLFRGRSIFKQELMIAQNPQDESFLIDKTWAPINNAKQKIPSGEYTVQVTLDEERQTPEFLKKLNAIRSRQVEIVYPKEYKFLIGSKDVNQKERATHRKMYVVMMKRMNKRFVEIQEKKRLALRRNREFFTSGRFDKKKWGKWYRELEKEINKDLKVLEETKSELYTLYYPSSHHSVETFGGIILTTARVFSSELYRRYKINVDVETTDVADAKDLKAVVKVIQRLHSKMAVELELKSLRKVFGYLPPRVLN